MIQLKISQKVKKSEIFCWQKGMDLVLYTGTRRGNPSEGSARSLKTKQETSISTNIIKDIGITKKQNQNALAFELNQMESLILAQDERWRHA